MEQVNSNHIGGSNFVGGSSVGQTQNPNSIEIQIVDIEKKSSMSPVTPVLLSRPIHKDDSKTTERLSYKDSAERKLRTGRKHNRYLNAKHLDKSEVAAPNSDTENFTDTDEDDDITVEEEYIYEEYTSSAFADLFENEPLWEKWRDLTEDQQKEIMSVIENETRSKPNNNIPTIKKEIRKKKLQNYVSSPFLTDIEKELINFIEYFPPRNLVCTHTSELYRIELCDNTLNVVFKDSYHRLLFHEICSYYSLESKSINKGSERVTIVTKPHTIIKPVMNLVQYLSLSSQTQ